MEIGTYNETTIMLILILILLNEKTSGIITSKPISMKKSGKESKRRSVEEGLHRINCLSQQSSKLSVKDLQESPLILRGYYGVLKRGA
nr:hypothetical protein [Candidatus Freyrarchaeum guaymaensis]